MESDLKEKEDSTIPVVESLTEKLQSEFCPPLDSALLFAILSDYAEPITEPQELEIRELLQTLLVATDTQIGFDDEIWEGEDSLTTLSSFDVETEVENALLAWSLEEKVQNDDQSELLLRSNRNEGIIRVDEEEDDPIKFLASVFPRQSLTVLRSRLDDALLDIETVVELLLNEDYIRISESSSSSSSSNSSSSSYSPLASSSSASSLKSNSTRQQRRKIKSNIKNSQTIYLNDVLHRSPPTISTPLLPSVTINALSSAPKMRDNSWITLDSTSTYLSTLLRISPGRITSTYHRLDSSLPLTISKILTSLSTERPASTFPSSSISSLRIVLPSLTTTQLELLLSATEGDVSDSIDLQSFLEELERREGSLIQNGLIGFGFKANRSVEVIHGVTPEINSSPKKSKSKALNNSSPDWNVNSTKKRFNITSTSNTGELYTTLYTAEECSELAREYHEKRNDAYKSAARHFQKGGGGERGAAWYWADVGRDMDKKKRSWEEKAAFAIVGERRTRDKTDTDQVDLHGLTLNHALSVVKQTCNTWWSSSSGTPAPLRIITGVGKHSANQNPILMPAIANLLTREGWQFKRDGIAAGNKSGAFLVTGLIR